MKIFIDADGCPVVDSTILIAKQYNKEVVIICDTSHMICREGTSTVTVSKGADSVDFALVNMLAKNDVAITQDYGLAAMCLARGAICLNQNGLIYNDDNIDALLLSRATAKKIRRAGGRLKGPSKRTEEMNVQFEKSLNEILKRGTE